MSDDRAIVEQVKKLAADTVELKNLLHERVVKAVESKLKTNNYVKSRLRVETHNLIEYLPYSAIPSQNDWSFDDKGNVKIHWSEGWYGKTIQGEYTLELAFVLIGEQIQEYYYYKKQQEVDDELKRRADQQRVEYERQFEELKRKLGQS